MSIKMKKLMSLLMCCVMLFGMLPVEAFATETGAETGIAAEENVAEVPAEVAPSADDSAADPAQILYNTLKSFNDYEALCAYLKSLSAEQLEMLKKFFAEQEMDLDAWIEAFQQQETTVEESAAEPAEDQAVQEEPAAISLETSLEREVLKAGKPSKPDGNGGHGDPNPDHEVTAPDTVSHIDVACEDLTAMIGGEPVTFSFTEEDVRNGAVVIYINDTKFTGTVGESDDNAGNNQVRLKGSFYIGKEDAPKEYTVKLEKTVTTEKYGKVAVTLSVTTNYWAENNVCPGKKSGGDPGIDVKLGVGEGTPKYTQLNISKVVEGLTLSEDKTFTFDIKKDEEIVETVTIVVKAGSAAGVTMVTGLPEGTYTVEERTDSAGVAGYRCDVTYTGNPAEVSYNAAASVEVKNTYAAVRSFSQEFGTVKITGKKIWVDDNNANGMRPDSIIVNLYADGVKVASQKVTGPDWSWSFDLSNGVPGSGKNPVGVTFTIGEENIPNYELTDVTQPTVTFNYPSADNGWEKTEPCSELNISSTQDAKSIIVAKKGNKYICWSVDALTAYERKLIVQSAAAAYNYSNNVSDYTFFSGMGSSSEFGMTVTETQILFDGSSNWSWFIKGTYNRGSASSTESSLTNTVTPVTISGSKIWKDANNQDNLRPAEITIRLLANGQEVDSKIVTEKDNWSWSFGNLPKYKDGKAIVYTITEDAVSGYTTEISGYNVINTHTPEQTSVSVTKVWDDKDNQDGLRPESVIIELLANGETTGKTLALNAGNNWTGSFIELNKYAAGQEITYTIKELTVAGYTSAITGNQAAGYTVTNIHTPETLKVEGTKTWVDNNNQDGKRPASITINLLADGEIIDSKTVTADDNWSWSFTNLPKNKDGVEIVYSITENSIEDYSTEYKGYNVINTHTPAKTSVTVTKVWDDANNQDGIRPAEVTITLLVGGEDTGKTLVLNAGNNWTGSFTDLDKYAAGQEITYSVKELTVAGYTSAITGNQAAGYTVTNIHTPETVEVSGSKTWNDNNNQDGARPESITINLLADGEILETVTVTAEDGWAWSFTNLPKNKDGVEIVYSITENSIEDYSTEYNGYNVINTHAPAQTSVAVTKVWNDANNQDGIRPNAVTIQLLANGEDTGKTLVLNAGNNWTGSFTELDKFENGVEIVYTVDELKVNGYKTVITGDKEIGYTVTNTHTPETLKVEGTKTWVDNNNQDGKRPASITINLLADGKVIKTVTVTEADDWAWSFTELPKFEDRGKEITYTITENAVAEYETEVNGYNVTNTHKIEKTSVAANKVWVDNNDQDGIRPNTVTIQLLADGKATDKTLVLNAGNNWTGSFTDLDKYAAGKEITYSVKELTVAGYTSAITGNQAEGYTVTNTHIPAVVEISGTKTWKDNNDQDGTRPASITINLVKDGKVIATKTVTAADGWSWSFEGLPKYENHGAEIIYSITENAVEDYTTTYNGYDVINTHTPEKTSVTVTKAWKDNNDQDGIRPNDVTIKLLANGKDTRKTLVLNAANGWTGSFTGLDKFAEGKEVVYTVEELDVEGYTSVITGSKAAGFTVTNTHEPETLDISGKKTWDDEDNQDGKRPASITIRLLANGVEVDRITVTEAEGWDWNFNDLPKYENHGKEITYTITEDSVEGYTASYNGFNVTNKYTPEETSVTVTKSWQDNNDQDGIRPEKIIVNLLANGKKTASAELTAEGNWTHTFAELDVYANGEKIVYTVEEEAVEGYETVITGDASKGFTVTNSHTAETLEVSGKKIWEDDNNRDGKRPASITVRLLANGKEVAVATVTAEDAWSFKFTNLPKFEAGKEIVYTVTEDAVAGYSVEYSDKNFDITNKYTPGKTSITVTKRWIDGNNHDSIRPSSITIYLYADDVKVAELKLTAKDNWTGVFDNLHIYENGKAIEYSISEKSVRGYNATFTGSAQHGFTVTNTHNIIPKTGDESNLPMYVSMFGASVCALAVLMFLAKSKKKGKNAR